MKVGNIVSTKDLLVLEDFNVVKSLDDIIQGLPTLIIGWEYIKKNYPDYSIVNRQLSVNTYWTFNKNEKRELHEEDIYNFIELSYQNLISDIEYVFIDPILYSRRKLVKILKKLSTIGNIVSYQKGTMIYIYGNKMIFGVELSMCEFIGLDIIKLTDKIKRRSKVFLTHDSIFIEYKKCIENLNNNVKYIPYIYSIKNE